ncbi:unnamed protein product [Lactuca virosa]|uniref:Zinc knuckle CX2CX4HX4C domain-containing protein n=1 Tax=Lactuca virosa TaxID=75947 RepID=A0AAU9N089_9ASTR|nr:unnamed protein product [Lactuca virosa]
MPGRPKTKRVIDMIEKVGKHRVSKKGKKISCNLCQGEGDNKKTCPSFDRPRLEKLPTRVKRTKTTKGQNMESGTSQVACGVEGGGGTGMEGRGTKVIRETGTSQVTLERVNGRIPQVKRRKKSEMIIKKKLATQIMGKNGEGSIAEKPVTIR